MYSINKKKCSTEDLIPWTKVQANTHLPLGYYCFSFHKQQLYCLSKDYSNEPFLCNHDACILAHLPARTAVTCTMLTKHHGGLIRGPKFRSLHSHWRRVAQLRWPNAHAHRLEVVLWVLHLMQRLKSIAIYQKWLQLIKLQHKNFIGRRCHSNRGLKFAPRLIKELKNVMILSLSVCHDIITPFLLRYCFTYIVKCTFYNAIFN